MSCIFRFKSVLALGLLGILSVLLGTYMAIFGEVPSIGGKEALMYLVGIDRLMCIYPIGLGLVFCFKAKKQYDNRAIIE